MRRKTMGSLYWSHYWIIVESFEKQKITLAEKLELLKKLEQRYEK
jgi:hypothetical protein